MTQNMVLVADGTRARILSLEPSTDPRAVRRLVERLDLLNLEHELKPHERFTGQRSESRGHVLGHWYGKDDHRLRQDEEHVRRFAGLVASETVRLVRDLGAKHLAIVAAPKMLGFIRSEGPGLFKLGLEIREASAEVSRHSASELQTYLEKQELIPLEDRRAWVAHV